MAPKKRTVGQDKAEGDDAVVPPGAASPDHPAVRGTLRVRIDNSRPPSERSRRLISGIKFLFPGVKAKFPGFAINAPMTQVQAALLALTDSSAVRAAAVLKTLDNHAFLAALLDFAQDAAGVAATPRASEAALTLTPDGEAVDLSSDALYRLGLYHDAWPVPLTAEGIRESNLPPSPGRLAGSRKRKRASKKDAEEAERDDGGAGAETAQDEGEREEIAAPWPEQQRQDREERLRRRGDAATPQKPTPPTQGRRASAKTEDDAPAASLEAPSAKRRKKKAAEGAGAEPEAALAGGEMEVDAKAPQEPLQAPVAAEEPTPAVPAEQQNPAAPDAAVQEEAPIVPSVEQEQKQEAAELASAQEEAPAAPAAAAPLEEPAAAVEQHNASQEQPAAPQESVIAPQQPPAEQEDLHIGGGGGDTARRTSARQSKPLHNYAADLFARDDEGEDLDVGGHPGEEIDIGTYETQSSQQWACPPVSTGRRPVGRPSSAGPRAGSRPGSSLLTEEEVQNCYWLCRTGLEAASFTSKKDRHDPPAPLRKEDLTSCHDCQAAHKRHKCTSCGKSYCQKCCKHYEYLFDSDPDTELGTLKRRFCEGECPCCLEICARRLCLRTGDVGGAKKGGLPPPPRHTPADRRIMALHAATCLKGPAAAMLADAEHEAARQGTSIAAARQMLRKEVDEFRLLCNRCATTMENMMMHCAGCKVDICPRCCADLAGGAAGALRCPGCHQTGTTSLQRALTSTFLAKVERAGAVVDAARSHGDAAANAYDYGCKLWRLTKPGDARPRPVPRQSCQTVPNGAAAANGGSVLQVSTSSAAANGGAGPSRAVVVNGGAPVLQSVVTVPPPSTLVPTGPSEPPNGNGTSPDPFGRLSQETRAALLLKLAAFSQISPDLLESEEVCEALGCVLATEHLQMKELPSHWAATPEGRQLGEAVRAAQRAAAAQLPAQPSVVASALVAPAPAVAPALLPGSVTGPLPLPPRSLAPIPGCIDLVSWHKGLPPADYRLAAVRPDGVQNRLWTPHVADFAATSPRRHETVQRFVERWAAGEPIIIRGVRGRMNWGPGIVMRAARDLKEGQKDLDVIDCSDWSNIFPISADTFFREYTACHGPETDAAGRPLRMLKLRDFPPNDSFSNKCVRHNADFIEMLNSIMPEYMHPGAGALNLAAKLPKAAVPPDLGPKGYIAFGREEEHEGEGDNVTRMHEDLSDAINVMCHVQRAPGKERGPHPPARCGEAPAAPPSFCGAGALWDLFRRQDIPTLRVFIRDVLAGKVPGVPPFVKEGRILGVNDVVDPVHDQSIMLTEKHRAAMRAAPYNLHPWVVEQYEHEAVLIPAACVHQVRNLRASIKIALDFVSPESVGHNLAQREERRVLGRAERTERGLPEVDPREEVGERHYHDKLQVSNMVMHGLREAVEILEEGV